MLEDLIYCLNATMPIFLLMVAGYFLRRIEILSKTITKDLNRFVFVIALPVLVFNELSTENFSDIWDTYFVIFCFLATLISIIILLVICICTNKITDRAEFVQASFRSSAALLGVGIAQNLYGRAGFVSLMIVGAVPLYNITAVVLLSILKPGNKKNSISKEVLIKTLKGIITNPIIIGIALGFAWSVLGLGRPVILDKTLNYIGGVATPIGLMALGASLEIKSFERNAKTIALATFFKLVGFVAIFLPVAIHLGYRTDKLIAILIMLGSPTTVSSFVMAKSMGHDGQTSAGTVMCTTLLAAFTLTLWLFIVKRMNLI